MWLALILWPFVAAWIVICLAFYDDDGARSATIRRAVSLVAHVRGWLRRVPPA